MKPKLLLVSLAALLAVAVGSVRASDPVGIYCLLNKVVLEPNDTEPTSAQIWGAFSFAVTRRAGGSLVKPAGGFGNEAFGDVYGPVQVGYLYYTCAKGTDATCANEWHDLKAVAGTGKVVGFASRYGANGSVRQSTQSLVKLANPDVYPLNIGVIPIGQSRSIFPGGSGAGSLQYPDLVAALTAALARK